MTRSIHIIDPGAMEAGGHHFALIETILASSFSGDLVFHTHKNLDRRSFESIVEAGYDVDTVFEQNFYEYYGQNAFDSASAVDVLSYVARLKNEYDKVLLQIYSNSEKQVCFYPCLDWYHLLALRLAMPDIETGHVVHRVCLMFDIGVAADGSRDWDLLSHWLPQLRWAADHASIELYAADSRILSAWDLLATNTSIKVMPSYLAYWPSVPKRQDVKGCNTVLAYTGDVKADKGFKELPNVVRELLADQSIDQVIVQFTWNWDMPELESCKLELRRLAQDESRFGLFEGPWTHIEFAQTIADSSAYYCTYDRAVYDGKSSGLPVWLGFYNVSLLGYRPKALEDELYYIEQHPAYKEALYSDLIEWFQS
ncbi:hypothetical protein [uncultured Umboniibacter sp.]|uniref:hypothetical protein n=1 Tax=uncultured Umboniibacter sp. TaxID=1798917 RepID=UPI0026063088|nr:hypothetical protein [uncultured Umboniibacter sp.]